MAFDFPASPTNGQVFSPAAGVTYVYNGYAWALQGATGGGGNVSNSGTPTAAQYAKWVDATHIQGVAPATVLSDIGAQPAGSYQPLDADLTALAALTGTNVIYYRSATDTWAAVTIGANLTFTGGTLAAAGGGGGASVTISDTAPGSPSAGNLWWQSSTGKLYIFYNDGTSSQWVLAGAPSGAAVLPGTPILIQSQTISGAVAGVDFVSGIDATYDEYEIRFWNVRAATTLQNLAMVVSQDNGASWLAGTQYNYQATTFSSTTQTGLQALGTNQINFTTLGNFPTTAPAAAAGKVWFQLPAATGIYKNFLLETGVSTDSGGINRVVGAGTFVLGMFNGVRIKVGVGNIAAGTFNLYGIKK